MLPYWIRSGGACDCSGMFEIMMSRLNSPRLLVLSIRYTFGCSVFEILNGPAGSDVTYATFLHKLQCPLATNKLATQIEGQDNPDKNCLCVPVKLQWLSSYVSGWTHPINATLVQAWLEVLWTGLHKATVERSFYSWCNSRPLQLTPQCQYFGAVASQYLWDDGSWLHCNAGDMGLSQVDFWLHSLPLQFASSSALQATQLVAHISECDLHSISQI